MMNQSPCVEFETDGVDQRYVAGRSSEAEAEAFEQHLIGCRACQQAVRLGVAVRAELAREATLPEDRGAARGARPRSWLRTATVTLAAATIVLAFFGKQWMDQRPLRALGEIAAAPSYDGVEVRTAEAPADSLFAVGMKLYVQGERDAALQALASARASGADSTPTSFFIAALHLLERNPRAALRELDVVLHRAESPYTAEAHYYAAKAWLQLARPDSARPHLEVAGRSQLPIAALARALTDSVSEAQR